MTLGRVMGWTAALLVAGGCGAAQAAWPDDQSIDLVVGFAPGGGTDLMARAMAPYVEKRLGGRAHIVVVNKPGAGGEISSSYVSRAKPDGYTVGFINAPGFMFIPMYKKTAYLPSEMRIIARVVDDPALLVARKDARHGSLKSIVEALRNDPGSLSFATSGRGTSGHIALMKIEKEANVRGTDIAFKGAGEFKSALLGGHVDYAFMSVAEFLVSNDENSPLRPIVLFHDQPMPVLPGVPTAAQEGYTVLVSSERGIAGPLALPDDIAGRLEGAIRDTLADPVFIKSVRSDAPVLSFVPGRAWTQSLNALPATLEPFVGKMKD
ncbi:MAG: tripartite tricarboxylate transporter substrate binding protein [Burkholderiales bacterium]